MQPIEIMHNIFGSGHPSNKCGDCSNLVKHGDYYKCRIYGESRSEATDWRKKWNSCAMFNMPYKGIPIKDIARYLPRIEEEQIEGQMTIFDLMEKQNENRIREYLDRRHMSQRELAERLDVTEVTISRYVTGMREPKLRNALVIAKELGCTVEELFDV